MILSWGVHQTKSALPVGYSVVFPSYGSGGAPPVVIATEYVLDMYRTYHIKSGVFTAILVFMLILGGR